ncbi:RNA polymerase II C-terminal domain kinase beta subunit [Vermiconidia calcicola]|uniref:RNA polymerase II C-terminal domain kinase beta subunit n=1 Tax=Vermiconidia calcicola TaxID=1690605 RepID=A0ACC3MP19_9PEZI|nr:RNA polymerase II C-terminal domain kinase beta subunit [Vermiconidia calcicola]
MVYVPWQDYGICKYWMLKRCYTGDACRYEHPEPNERKRLWDSKLAEQDEAAKRGIPRPQPPPREATDRGIDDAHPYGPRRAPPPPPATALPEPDRPMRPWATDRREEFAPGRAPIGTALPEPDHPVRPWATDKSGESGPGKAPPPLGTALPEPVPPVRPWATDRSGAYGPDRAPPPPDHQLTQISSHMPRLAPESSFNARPWDHGHETANSLQNARARPDSPALQDRQQSYQGLDGAQPSSRPPHSGTGIQSLHSVPPASGAIDLFIDPEASRSQSIEVSMLDAPPSPSMVEPTKKPKNANRMPLGKPNRLQSARADSDVTANVWEGPNAAYLKKKVEEYARPSAFSSDSPSGNAVSVWKRADADGDTHMTSTTKAPERGLTNAYWRRLEQQQANDEIVVEQGGVGGTKAEVNEALARISELPRDNISTSTAQVQTSSSPPTTFAKPELPASKMGATKRLSNGEAKHVGPHPSIIRVSAPYMSQSGIEKKLQPTAAQGQFDVQERSIAEAREDSMRLQGCTWIDNVRRALQLPIRTYTTACVYYHKFRLAHPGTLNGMEYGSAWADACAASLLTACKVEDTLKKSRDILAAAYNLKSSTLDQLGSDDTIFEAPSRAVVGLERMVLEAGGFDFRSKYPHKLLAKIAKTMPEGEDGERQKVYDVAWTVLTDLHRTFAPLKQTSATMALASLELAAHLAATTSPNNVSATRDQLQRFNIDTWSTSREEIMETLLDLLDLYTQHTSNTILGLKYSLDDFLRIRLALNKECSENNLSRHTTTPSSDRPANGSTLRVANGHPTPVSPPQPGAQQHLTAAGTQAIPEGGGTLRFMLNPQLAFDEKAEVQKYFVEEWEEYEEEIEIPAPRPQSREREKRPSLDRSVDGGVRGGRSDSGGARGREDRERERERERLRASEREIERERARLRDRERERDRDRRYDDRRYDERDRRYDDRRDRRYDDRRPLDDRRRRDDRR